MEQAKLRGDPLSVHSKAINSIAFSPESSFFASAGSVPHCPVQAFVSILLVLALLCPSLAPCPLVKLVVVVVVVVFVSAASEGPV